MSIPTIIFVIQFLGSPLRALRRWWCSFSSSYRTCKNHTKYHTKIPVQFHIFEGETAWWKTMFFRGEPPLGKQRQYVKLQQAECIENRLRFWAFWDQDFWAYTVSCLDECNIMLFCFMFLLPTRQHNNWCRGMHWLLGNHPASSGGHWPRQCVYHPEANRCHGSRIWTWALRCVVQLTRVGSKMQGISKLNSWGGQHPLDLFRDRSQSSFLFASSYASSSFWWQNWWLVMVDSP